MIHVDNLSVRLGKRMVLEGVSAQPATGRVTAILGANGAGKTSLLRAIAGLVPAATGSVRLAGTPVEALALNARAKLLGYLPQNGQPAWALTVRELVELGRLPHRNGFAALSSADHAAVESAMEKTDVTHLASRTVDTLSGGERARAKFARVLAAETRWILADEPLANLDLPHQRDVLNLMRGAADAGKGVIVVLHQLEAAARVADDILILKDGRLLASGPALDVIRPTTLESAFDMSMDVVDFDGRVAVLPR